MAETIDLRGFATADDTAATFMPARPPADRARPSPPAEDAAQCVAGAARAATQPQSARSQARATRAAGRGSSRRSEILAGWLIALVLLLGIGAWSLVAAHHDDRRDPAVRPVLRGAPAASAPEAWPRDDLADPRRHGDE